MRGGFAGRWSDVSIGLARLEVWRLRPRVFQEERAGSSSLGVNGDNRARQADSKGTQEAGSSDSGCSSVLKKSVPDAGQKWT